MLTSHEPLDPFHHIRRLIESDLLNGLCVAMAFTRVAERDGWPQELQWSLEEIRGSLVGRSSELIRELNRHCRQWNESRAGNDRAPDSPSAQFAADLPTERRLRPSAQWLDRQLAEARENLRIIEEHAAEFVSPVERPLQFDKDKLHWKKIVAELEQQRTAWSAICKELDKFHGLTGELKAAISLLGHDSPGSHLAAIQPIFLPQSAEVAVDSAQVILAAGDLWAHFGRAARALVTVAFVWIKQLNTAQFDQEMERAFAADASLRILARDYAFRDWPPVQKFATLAYHWPSRIKHARVERPSVMKFLSATGLKANPFQPGAAAFDPLLLVSYATVLKADDISSPRPMLLVSADQQDRDSLRLLMGGQYQPLGLPPGVPAVCELTEEFKATPQLVKAYLSLVARDAARAWFEFLSLNAGVWFDLAARQQRALVELLVWREQSKQRPLDLLSFTGPDEHGEAQALLEELAERLEKATLVAQPDESDLMRWLEVRPPGLNYTYALLECPFTGSQEIETALSRIVAVSNRLLETDVILKVFTAESPRLVLGDDLDTIPIRWSERNLTQMLNDRIRLTAERGYLAFVDLFYPDNRAAEVTTELIREANGSLGRLQRLGQRIILAHVAADLDAWDVDLSLKTLHEQQ